MSEEAVRFQSVSFSYPGTKEALRGVDFSIPKGKVFGFLGPNGAGKTTTIRLILGLLRGQKGRIEVFGLDPATNGPAVRTQCGALLHDTGIYEHLSALENLEFFGRAHGLAHPFRSGRAKSLLDQVGLWERKGERPASWSRGMKQRLAVARALLPIPSLLLLDEPTTGLDVESARQVRDLIQAMTSTSGTTVFLTTHNMQEAETLCDEVAVVSRGRVVGQGVLEEMVSSAGASDLEEAYLNLQAEGR